MRRRFKRRFYGRKKTYARKGRRLRRYHTSRGGIRL